MRLFDELAMGRWFKTMNVWGIHDIGGSSVRKSVWREGKHHYTQHFFRSR